MNHALHVLRTTRLFAPGGVAALCLLVAGAGAVAMPVGGPGGDPGGERPVAATRNALEQWVELRKVISQEKRDWAEGRELLADRIEIVRREIAARRQQIEDARASIGTADEKLAELVAERDGLKAASTSLDGSAAALEERTLALLGLVPDPIRERVKPLSQRFPEADAATKLSLSERFQNVVGVLNEVNKFNREVSVSSEVRDLAGGTTAEVTALYVGIGQGYYVTADKRAAGVGRSGAAGWEWAPANDAAAEIAEAVAILQGEAPARFVQLPIRIE